ncbi:AAA family ATPase [Sporosarcina sp. SAFN-010]|uniref:AAA family ATPase n=1 Tax=Sporosarcina sp. SAFN-010 TaxID=3387273 RepID=UPI003F7EA201
MQTEQFSEWLIENNVKMHTNYISRLGKVEEVEEDLDKHFEQDKCASLLKKFTYTTSDKINEKDVKHQIPIEPRDAVDLYQAYYQETNDYRSRITKYIEFKEAQLANFATQIDDLPGRLTTAYNELLNNNQLLPLPQLNDGYELFAQKFGPAQLHALDGEELLDTLLNIGNRDGMTYWLEFKNDNEFQTNAHSYGSIAGGSSFKFILFNRNLDNKWVTGNPQNPTILSLEGAIQLGREIRDALVAGAELIKNLPEHASVQDYIELQVQLEVTLKHNMYNLGWVHKYYHMIYPDKIDSFHSTLWQKYVLISSRILPVQEDKLYTMTGQLMQIARQIELPTTYVMLGMIELFGAPINYFRIDMKDSVPSHWSSMKKHSYIGIGWPDLGDLSTYPDLKTIRNDIETELKAHYNYDPNEASRKAGEIIRFLNHVQIGDIVVAVEEQQVLGIGQVAGDYEYHEDRPVPHTKQVDWIRVFDQPITLPKVAEGARSTCVKYRDLNNIFEIDRLIVEKVEEPKPTPIKTLPPLKGIPAQVNNVLKRKKQVILYGPPGTGKTFHAENTCLELSARNVFSKSYNDLSSEELKTLKGDGRNTGTVRMCCFHPSYGYEDFIEGIKPSAVNGQTVFELKEGIFKSLCKDAAQNPQKDFYLIIDEINRGDISRIFGELIMLIESGKRGKSLTLSHSNTLFSVPPNVYIVGTMNTADRSIALLDVALRRRFGFIELLTDYKLFEGVTFEGLPLGPWLEDLNNRIREHIGNEARNLQIGHSYFLDKEKAIEDHERFKWVIKEDIIPLIEEYSYSDFALVEKILGEGIVDVKKQLIRTELFNGPDISDLVSALLSQNPKLRVETEVEVMDPDVEEENHDEEEQ